MGQGMVSIPRITQILLPSMLLNFRCILATIIMLRSTWESWERSPKLNTRGSRLFLIFSKTSLLGNSSCDKSVAFWHFVSAYTHVSLWYNTIFSWIKMFFCWSVLFRWRSFKSLSWKVLYTTCYSMGTPGPRTGGSDGIKPDVIMYDRTTSRKNCFGSISRENTSGVLFSTWLVS